MAQPDGKADCMHDFPEIQAKLLQRGGNIAILGTKNAGKGIDLAALYPSIQVHLFVPHQSCLASIHDDVKSVGLELRVKVHHLDFVVVDDLVVPAISYDMVYIDDFCTNPDSLLKMARKLGRGATIVVTIEEYLLRSFTGEATNIPESMCYGISLIQGLPENKAFRGVAEVGYTLRLSQLELLAIRAGFRSMCCLPKRNGNVNCVLSL
jgi:hypothetical protein